MRVSLLSLLPFVASALAINCNGYAELCDRRYSNVTFIGAHDSPFDGILPTENQYDSVASQLGNGVRFLTAQTHNDGGTIQLCHTSCIELNAGTLQTFLTTVKTFLDANVDEVVTLLITNGDGIAISDFGDVFETVGLNTYAYAPSGDLTMAEWPTLGTLIADGTRLVVFMDYGADTSEVAYILNEFQYFFETPYDTTDASFPECTLDRPAGASANGLMMIVNHFLDLDILGILIPDTLAIETTNSLSSIQAQGSICYSDYGRIPNVILLDYVDVGEGLEAQDDYNGV
ncbi:PLC-like phosphodiesterase [Xylariales sp. PMI_506]|nr:PLC-like phosphodiesterase [Xylariales sp. PMI_506]